LQLLFSIVFSLLLTACQGTHSRSLNSDGDAILRQLSQSCSESIQAFRAAVTIERVRNAGAPTLTSNPLLHSNRFLTGLSLSVHSDSEVREWTGLLADLAIQTRESENQNLSVPWSGPSLEELAACSNSFATAGQYAQERRAILEAVQESGFPDNYLESRQVIGALPLLRPFLKQRILALHEDERRSLAEDKYFPRSNSYELVAPQSTLESNDIADWMRRAYGSNELAVPLLEPEQLDALFVEHAPSLQIEFENDRDRLAAPQWLAGQLSFNSNQPTAYTLPSMTRFEGRNLLQLNYVFWFSGRGPVTLIDLYSGFADSIIWRVTLDEEGQVLLYDSIHSCGCYHKFFLASERIKAKVLPASREPANIISLNALASESRPALSVTANEHYIVGVDLHSHIAEQGTLGFQLTPYEQLQNLNTGLGTRSLFDERGLIAGSERLERFTLWPTGILSVGAMRQWGTHATGFIEEQHFDDHNLLDKYFETRH